MGGCSNQGSVESDGISTANESSDSANSASVSFSNTWNVGGLTFRYPDTWSPSDIDENSASISTDFSGELLVTYEGRFSKADDVEDQFWSAATKEFAKLGSDKPECLPGLNGFSLNKDGFQNESGLLYGIGSVSYEDITTDNGELLEEGYLYVATYVYADGTYDLYDALFLADESDFKANEIAIAYVMDSIQVGANSANPSSSSSAIKTGDTVISNGTSTFAGSQKGSEAEQIEAYSNEVMGYLDELLDCIGSAIEAAKIGNVAEAQRQLQTANEAYEGVMGMDAPSLLSSVHAQYKEAAIDMQSSVAYLVDAASDMAAGNYGLYTTDMDAATESIEAATEEYDTANSMLKALKEKYSS